LNTIREIIIHNSKCLEPYLIKLLPLLIEHSRNEDEQIRNLVAESIGRLFIVYSNLMSQDIERSFKSQNNLERATIVKSFKYAGAKDTDAMDLESALEFLLKLVGDHDLNVKRNALESINAIVHNQPSVIRGDIELLHKMAISETVIKPELITEVDLGPFKHKVDEGIPIRKNAYALLDTMVEKIPERSDLAHITEISIKGLDDSAEECMILCLHLIGRLIQCSPTIVVSNMDHLVDSFEK
jgi:cullin-associated NEDD8-dissociated protein 1